VDNIIAWSKHSGRLDPCAGQMAGKIAPGVCLKPPHQFAAGISRQFKWTRSTGRMPEPPDRES
jgi:hypothetical protein